MRTTIRKLYQSLSVFLVLLIAFSPTFSAAAQAEAPQIRITQVDNSKFPQVTVYVSVTNAAGEPVGVDPNEIQISENGQVMKPDNIGGSGEIGPLTTLLVMDVSGSMLQAGKLQAAKDAATAYVDQMRPGDQAGLLIFNTQVKFVQPLTTDHQALAAAIKNLNAQSDTAMYDALDQGTQILKDVAGRKAIIVLTDGMDNVSKTSPDQVIEAIEPNGLSISTIGLGDAKKSGVNSGLDEAGLRTLSERAGGIYSYANDPSALQGLYQRYARALQSEYRFTFTSPSKLRDGSNRTLSASLTTPGNGNGIAAQVQYNPGGVLPEVAQTVSWPIFGAILGGLLLLLFVPLVIGNISRGETGREARLSNTKKSNIKLK